MAYTGEIYEATRARELGVIEADAREETVTAPALGAVITLAYKGFLSETLEVVRTDTESPYVEDIDYKEVPGKGFINLAIPQGVGLTLTYFTRSSPTLLEAGVLAPFLPDVQPPPASDDPTAPPDPGQQLQDLIGDVVGVVDTESSSVKLKYATLLKMGV